MAAMRLPVGSSFRDRCVPVAFMLEHEATLQSVIERHDKQRYASPESDSFFLAVPLRPRLRTQPNGTAVGRSLHLEAK